MSRFNYIITENVLGFYVVTAGKEECINRITEWIQSNEENKTLVCANPHSLVKAEDDPPFRNAIHDADMIVPDGVGILAASWILGGTIRERVTGSDIFQGINEVQNLRKGFRCFFLGSTEETLARIRERMVKDFPNVTVAGCYSPPFRNDFSEEDNWMMIEAVNQTMPDVLWVGMTAPKQEKWIHQNKHKLNVKFIGAVGAVFDFYAGNVKRSNPWFLKHGLEWLPRLIQEPRRLWRRTLVSAPVFFWRVFIQRIRNIKILSKR